jgi:hypothetical protein
MKRLISVRLLIVLIVLVVLVVMLPPTAPRWASTDSWNPFSVLLRAQSNGALNVIYMHATRLTADCTDGGGVTTLQNPCAAVTTNAGPQVGFPANPTSQAYYLDCDLWYSQATAVADSYGVQFSSSPTNAQIGGWAFTNATALAAGTPATITNTTATAAITFTPAVATVLDAHMAGLIEIPATNQDVNMSILVSQATAANVIVTKRGSVCRWWALQ